MMFVAFHVFCESYTYITHIHVSIINIENLRREKSFTNSSSFVSYFSTIWNRSLEIQFKNNILYQRRFESGMQS